MEALATTQRLAIRTLRSRDAERLFRYRADPEVSRLWFKGAWVDDMICAMLRREWHQESAVISCERAT
jgi:RimJ/RimL family protein N-acetyltransferase